MKQILTLALLASSVGACKTTQKVQTNRNQEITKEIKQPTKKVETNKNEEIKKEFRQPKQKIEVLESNKKYFFGDYAQYESLNIKLMNTWYSAFQDLKTASGNDLNAKQDALLSVVKKVAKGKDQEFGDREVVIPKARELVKSLEAADAKLMAAILKAKEPFNKLKPYKYNDNNKIIEEIKKKAIIRLNKIEIKKLVKKRKDIIEEADTLKAAVDRVLSPTNKPEEINKKLKEIEENTAKKLATPLLRTYTKKIKIVDDLKAELKKIEDYTAKKLATLLERKHTHKTQSITNTKQNEIEMRKWLKKREDIIEEENALKAKVDVVPSPTNTQEKINEKLKKIEDDAAKKLANTLFEITISEKGTLADDKILSREAARLVDERYSNQLTYEIFLGKGKKLDELKNAFVEEQTQKESKALQDAKEVIYESAPEKRK